MGEQRLCGGSDDETQRNPRHRVVKQLYKAEAKPRTNALSERLIRWDLRNGSACSGEGGRVATHEVSNDDGHEEGCNDTSHRERRTEQRYGEKYRIETKLWGGHEESHRRHRGCTTSDERLVER